MKKVMTFIGALAISSAAMAQTNICKVQELSYNGIGTAIVASHTLEILTLDKVTLDLGFSGKRVELQRTLDQNNGEFVAASVLDSASGETLTAGPVKSDLRIGDSFGKSVSVSCAPEGIK